MIAWLWLVKADPAITHAFTCHFSSPMQRGKKSASNFDPEFTKEPCRLSPVDSTVIAAIEPEVFDGFSFTNPEYYITQ